MYFLHLFQTVTIEVAKLLDIPGTSFPKGHSWIWALYVKKNNTYNFPSF